MEKIGVALIDYGSGNVRSVRKALEHEGAGVALVSDPAQLGGFDKVVLPGVGAFGDCVRNLRQRGMWEPLEKWMAADKPFLGICVGYQLLFESSEEAPGERGFGFFPGVVQRFRSGLKVPQIGWNELAIRQPVDPLLRGIGSDAPAHVYFVHSYYPNPTDPDVVTSTATYGETFAATASRGNVAGVQFHPEKSQTTGLRILRNFIHS
jgi:glutamine amidotransferase